ncbi:uncharacterized protein [Spinacia oleracea]|nr:uncharacterized protein LOC130470553 isoform X2 [Spinacia oleracea]XP_056696849.1 uncharacterized protein LOC130470553 isoform X2 [Spinacia oleracea]
MLRSFLLKETVRLNSRLSGFNQSRGIHSRNKKAMEFIAKGWSAMKEVDRVIDYCELNDKRLIPLLRNDYIQSSQQAFYYLEKVVEQVFKTPREGPFTKKELDEVRDKWAIYFNDCELPSM